jgi:penicillin-binding protein 1A
MDAMTLPRPTSWRERWRRARRPVALVLAVSYGIVLFLAFAWSQCFFDGCPNVESLAAYQPGGAPVLLDRNGEVFADLTPVEREVVPLFSLPSHVAQAFLAVEDKRFYEHNGIDWRRVGGAMLANLRSGDFAQGFSTITMQLARNLFPNRIPGEEQTPRRKLLEVRVAREIENEYSKDEILELYLNHIYFGNRARGIEAAAHQYFGHPAEELTLPEAALLAALPKAPTHYDPRRHPEKARERRNLVITLMEEQGRIPWIQAKEAREAPLRLAPAPRQTRVESGLAPYFVEQVRRELEERFGPALYTRPLRVVTTLDSRIQRAAEEELLRQLKLVESGTLGAFQGPRYSALAELSEDGTPYLQGAFVLLEAQTGDVLAWVGGRNYAHSQFDRVSLARRQPGSAFKPFVYAAALEDGFVLSQPLIDRPLRVRLPGGRVWEPKNFSGRYDGRVTVRDALVRSKNVATVRLANAIGLGQVAGVARQAGIGEPVAELPSISLGTIAVSPLELTSAYSAFAGLGEAVEPRLVLRVEDEEGRVFWTSRPERQQVLEPAVSYLITDVLSDALERGTGAMVREVGVVAPAAGKTGTTNDGADTWFVGYTPDLVGGVWIGFDKPRPILQGANEEGATGGRLAAPLWGRIVRRAYQARPRPEPWELPPGVIAHQVDPQTGLLLEPGCSPLRGRAYEELFVEGIEPEAYCPGKEPAPRDGFPAARMIAQRKAREAEQKALLAQAREAEERKLREQREAEKQARLAEEQRRREEEVRLARIGEARRQAAEDVRRQREEEEKRQALLAEQKKRQDEQRLAQLAEARRRAEQEEREREEQRKAALLAQQKEREERERLARAEAEEKRRREATAERERKEKEAARLAEARRQQEKQREEREAAEIRKREEERDRLARAAAEEKRREAAAEKERKEKEAARLAETRRQQEKQREEREAAEIRKREEERDRLARAEAEEKRRREAAAEKERKEKEAARLAETRRQQEKEREAAAERERKERETARLAEARREQEKERRAREAAEIREREERLARAEAEADRRERDIKAREDALRRKREGDGKKESEDERIARVLEEERRAREEEAAARAARQREEKLRADREEKEEAEEDEAEATPETDLSGWWEMTNTIESTNYSAYKGLRLGYRVQLEQDGNRITGRGQKWSENGRTIPSAGRTPITVTGTVDGRKVTLKFTEHGARRTTGGGFSWTLSADRTALRGSFWSTAADTSGKSLARRMP